MTQNAARPTTKGHGSSTMPRQAKQARDRLTIKETSASRLSLFGRWPYKLLAHAAVRASSPAPLCPPFHSCVSARGCPRYAWRHVQVRKWGTIRLSETHAAHRRGWVPLLHVVHRPQSSTAPMAEAEPRIEPALCPAAKLKRAQQARNDSTQAFHGSAVSTTCFAAAALTATVAPIVVRHTTRIAMEAGRARGQLSLRAKLP